MFELLFLLLPVAVAYGWYMGRRETAQTRMDHANKMTRDYVNGVNYLLSNQKDRAIDLFLTQLKDNSATFETHITLGNLFRTRGEVERAIHIHRSLLESSTLREEEQLITQNELAQDYLSAGFYDRAETILLQLIQDEEFEKGAYKQLLILYQSTREWEKAIDCATALIKLGATQYAVQSSQFHCEIALMEIASDRNEQAIKWANKALAINPQCVRASIILGRIAMTQEDWSTACDYLMQTLAQNPIFVSEALHDLKYCFQQRPDDRPFKQFLEEAIEKEVGSSAELMLADLLERDSGRDVARHYITQDLRVHPNLNGFHRLIDYHLAEAEDGKAKESLMVFKNMVALQINHLPNYQCEQCGFTVKSLYWLCPRCRSWETIKPIRYFEQYRTPATSRVLPAADKPPYPPVN